jgi:DNA polymerase V
MIHSHGGKRHNAGRPRGLGPHGESTKPIRIPLSRVEAVQQFIQTGKTMRIPLYSNSIPAGFPSPADDHIESHLDLNDYLVSNPAATFMVRAVGDSMINAGINSGDILIVDRSITPTSGKIVIAAVDGELTVKRLDIHADHLYLVAENPNYPPIRVNESQDAIVWGVVTNVIHSV